MPSRIPSGDYGMKILERLFKSGEDEKKKEGLGRNDLCWCGSGKKYKRCHLDGDEEKRRKKTGLG